MYEISLDKYWGSIDARKEGIYFLASQAKYHVLVGPGMKFRFFFLLLFIARLYSNDGRESF